MASIDVLMNGQKQQTRAFEGERLIVGREPICNLQLNHPSVSRQHCAIARKGEVFILEDLHSSNGTFVNGRRISGSFYLNNGDDIQVGEYTLKFQFESQAVQIAPEFEPTMLMQNKEAQEALRKGIPPPEIAAAAASAPAPVVPPATPAAPPVRPPSAVMPVAPVLPVAAVKPVEPIAPPAPAAGVAPGQDLKTPAKFGEPFNIPTMRRPPIEIEPKKPAPGPTPPPMLKPSVPAMPPPLPTARPASAAGMPAIPPPLPGSGRAPLVPPPLPPQAASAPRPFPPPLPAAPPPLAPDDPRAAMTMLPPTPSVPPPPPMAPPMLAPNDPRAALTIPPPSSYAQPPVRTPVSAPIAGAPVYQTPRATASVEVVPSGPVEYAGFFARFAAMLLDGLIFALIMIPIMFILTPINILISRNVPVLVIPMVIATYGLMLLLMWLYYAKLESGPKMATFGKRIMGIQVTDLNGQRISFIKATVRLLVKVFLSGILLIGYLMAAFTEKKQALHDILAGCLVVRRKP